MKENKKLHLIYGIILSALIIASGIMLIFSCVNIYRSNLNSHPFHPQTISIHFQRISLLIYTTLIALVGGIALHLLFPSEPSRPKAIKEDDAPLKAQQKKASELLGQFSALSQKETIYRRNVRIICFLLFAVLATIPALYFTDINHFSVENLNQDIIKSLVIAFVPCCIGLCACHYCKHLCRKSYLRQAEIYKNAIQTNACIAPNSPQKVTSPKLLYIRGTLAILAICFILLGIFNGGARDVLLKAIAICTECIGLG